MAILSVTLEAGGGDDAYITYTFARNLAEGKGFVFFDGGPKVYGSTTLTYALLLAVAHSVGLPIPTTSMVVGALFWALSLIPLYVCINGLSRFSGKVSSEFVSFVGVAVAGLCIVPAVYSLGLETGLYCLLVFSSFALYATGRVRGSLIVAALTALTRLDGLLVGAVLATHILVSGGIKEGLVTALRRGWTAVLLLFVATVSLWWYFGNPLPQTFLAKASFPENVSGVFELSGYLWFFDTQIGRLLFYATGGLAIASVFFASRNPGLRSPAFALCMWVILYPLMFLVAGMPDHGWYYVPILPAVLALAALGACWLGVLWHASGGVSQRTDGESHTAMDSRMYMPAILVVAYMLVGLSFDAERWQSTFRATPWGEGGIKETSTRYRLSQTIAEDIRERKIENPDVMAFEIGYLGWALSEIPGARVHDILGLTSPEVYNAKGKWKPGILLKKHNPEYIMTRNQPNYPPSGWLIRRGILESKYERIATLKEEPMAPYSAYVRAGM